MSRQTFLILVLMASITYTGASYVIGLWEQMLIQGSYGDVSTVGQYGTGGNAGVISFDEVPEGYSWAEILGYGGSEVTLTGIFWIETAGWSTFGDSLVTLVPPGNDANVRDPWYLSGYAWSPNAWWIALNHGESYASGVAFLPDSRTLIGYGYNDMLGWIPFGSGITVAISEGFIGKVAIFGAIGWSKTFNVLYQVGGTFNNASMISLVNLVRKNVSILQRNAGAKINNNLSGASPISFNKSMMFRIDSNPGNGFLPYSLIQTAFDNDLDRSLIVIGADIYIDTGVTIPALLSQSRAIIALKNDNGEGGNIYIKWSVKYIESVLFAEKTIYSGEELYAGTLSPYYITKKSLFLDIPRTQLYIKGAIWGYNTIGWSSKDDGAVCPVFNDLPVACSYDNSIKYDWNYFRVYDGRAENRAYPNTSKDDYSVIIEYDPRTLLDPPPGLETLN